MMLLRSYKRSDTWCLEGVVMLKEENADFEIVAVRRMRTYRAVDDAKVDSKNFGRAKIRRIKRTFCTLVSDDRSGSTRDVQVHNGHI